MKRNNGRHSSSKGKGIEEDFNGLSLYSEDPSVPRSTQYDQSAYQGSDRYYHNEEYAHDTAATSEYSTHGGYGAGFPSAQRGSSSRDSYGTTDSLTNVSMSPSYSHDRRDGSSYAGSSYAPSSYAASSCAPSSYAPSVYAASSYAGSSYAPTVSSEASSRPPRTDPNNVNHIIAVQQPAQNRYELPCEFLGLTGCLVSFRDGEEMAWKAHIEDHLRSRFPTKLNCWFCETWIFDSNGAFSGGDKRHNFENRMDHIREHIVGEGCRAPQMRPDGNVIKQLRHEKIISSQEYNNILNRVNPTTVPPVPSSQPSRLEQVLEEPASSSRDRRHHERKDRHHESSKKRHSKR